MITIEEALEMIETLDDDRLEEVAWNASVELANTLNFYYDDYVAFVESENEADPRFVMEISNKEDYFDLTEDFDDCFEVLAILNGERFEDAKEEFFIGYLRGDFED